MTLIGKKISDFTNEELKDIANAMIDALHNEGSFDIGDPCMLKVCGLDYSVTGVEMYIDIHVEKFENREIPPDFLYGIWVMHCPSAEVSLLPANRKFLESYVLAVLPMLTNANLPFILWQK